jgi:hypothetical protein
MTTTNQMLARELPKPVSMAPGGVYFDDGKPVLVLGTFVTGKNTIAEVLAAASAVERLGHVPEIRFAGEGHDPDSIQLVTCDVPALIGKLRASLSSSTNHMEGRDKCQQKPAQ